MWGVLICCTSGIIWVLSMVMRKGLDGGRDAGSWAWLDVVSSSDSFGRVS